MSTTHEGYAGLPPLGELGRALANGWWLLMLRGIVAILFGIAALGWPTFTIVGLTLLWGAFAVVDGLLALAELFTGRGARVAPRWWLLVTGLAGVVAGMFAMLQPVAAAWILIMCIAAWALVVGFAQILGAIALRREIEGEWRLVLGGLISVAFGVLLFVAPGLGAVTFAWVIGLYAIFAGCALLLLAVRLKALKSEA